MKLVHSDRYINSPEPFATLMILGLAMCILFLAIVTDLLLCGPRPDPKYPKPKIRRLVMEST